MADEPKRRGRPPKPKVDAAPKKRGRPPKPKADPQVNPEITAITAALQRPVRRGHGVECNEETLRLIGECAKLFCTQVECAAMLGMTTDQLRQFFQANKVAREVWDDGLLMAKVSLRRKQFALADKNQIMSIFLGKNYLGQKDVQNIDANITKTANEMTIEQLMEIAGQAVPETFSKPKVH